MSVDVASPSCSSPGLKFLELELQPGSGRSMCTSVSLALPAHVPAARVQYASNSAAGPVKPLPINYIPTAKSCQTPPAASAGGARSDVLELASLSHSALGDMHAEIDMDALEHELRTVRTSRRCAGEFDPSDSGEEIGPGALMCLSPLSPETDDQAPPPSSLSTALFSGLRALNVTLSPLNARSLSPSLSPRPRAALTSEEVLCGSVSRNRSLRRCQTMSGTSSEALGPGPGPGPAAPSSGSGYGEGDSGSNPAAAGQQQQRAQCPSLSKIASLLLGNCKVPSSSSTRAPASGSSLSLAPAFSLNFNSEAPSAPAPSARRGSFVRSATFAARPSPAMDSDPLDLAADPESCGAPSEPAATPEAAAPRPSATAAGASTARPASAARRVARPSSRRGSTAPAGRARSASAHGRRRGSVADYADDEGM